MQQEHIPPCVDLHLSLQEERDIAFKKINNKSGRLSTSHLTTTLIEVTELG